MRLRSLRRRRISGTETLRARRLARTLAILVLALSCAPARDEAATDAAAGPDEPVHVVFDQSLDQVSSPFDTAYEGMSLLVGLLRQHGATVSLSSRPLAEFLPSIAGPGHVLVLGLPWQRRYSRAGLDAVRAFLASGGGVLVITEHDGMYANAEIQNALTAPYGITTLPENAPGRRDETAPEGKIWPLCRVEAWGLDQVRLYMPAPLVVAPPAERLVEIIEPDRPEADLVAAVNRELAGPLVVLADLEVLWNMSPTTGVSAGQNRAFLLRLFGLLAGREAGLEPGTPEPRIDAWSEGERVALFDSSGLGWYPDGAPHGLRSLAERLHRAGYRIEVGGGPEHAYADVDLLISVVPIAKTAEEPMHAAARMLLVSDGRTSLLRAEPLFLRAFLPTLRGTRYIYPLNRLAAVHGFSFLPVTLIARDSESMVASARLVEGGEPLPLHRSAVIALGENAQPAPVPRAFADRDYWPSVNLTPVLYDHWTTTPRRRPLVVEDGDRTVEPRLPVIVTTPRVMGIADLELVTDEVLGTPAGEPLMREILRWLARDAATPDPGTAGP